MRLTIIIILCIGLQSCSRIDILPQQILDYQLVKKISGDEANQMINKIHLQPVTDTQNEIGFYKQDNDQAIIYVTFYQSDDQAQTDLVKMVEKISPQNSIFINGGQFDVNKITIYRYFGMGQTHFVFRIGNKLFWFSVETMIAKDFLESYINYIQ